MSASTDELSTMKEEPLALNFRYAGRNVTEIVFDRCRDTNRLRIDGDYDELFSSEICESGQELIVVNTNSGLTTRVEKNTPLVIDLMPQKIHDVKIVYFIACTFEDRWREFLRVNLEYLKEIYADMAPDIHVCANVSHPGQEEELRVEMDSIPILAEITVNLGNDYEWVGINKAAKLSREFPDGVILYFHSKSISHDNPKPFYMYTGANDGRGPIGLSSIFLKYKAILEIFATFQNIMTVTPWGSNSGKAWHNFWWSRSRYIKTLDILEKGENRLRHDYERWLGGGLRNKETTAADWEKVRNIVYNLDSRKSNIGAYYRPQEMTGPILK